MSTTSFSFDLDIDGSPDEIAAPGAGSGFLVLDTNGDGKINDGSELFCPRSGDGFGELAAYDQDGNGWIDGADKVFAGLQIWSKDEQGNDRLVALGKLGIGAIYLGSIESVFAVKGAANEDLAQVKRTGMFVTESGQTGSVQEMDFTART